MDDKISLKLCQFGGYGGTLAFGTQLNNVTPRSGRLFKLPTKPMSCPAKMHTLML